MAAQSCQTSFLAAAQATPGLDFLVQAIQRGNLANVLPAAGSGATVFAPNNDAFTNMLQTLSTQPLSSSLTTQTLIQTMHMPHKLSSMCPGRPAAANSRLLLFVSVA